MAHRFTRPKPSPRVRFKRKAPIDEIAWFASKIRNQEELDRIMNQQPNKLLADAWLKLAAPHMKFQPLQLVSEPVLDS